MTVNDPASWLAQLFSGLLPEEHLDFSRHRDTPLTDLGLDSMAVMAIVLNMESKLGLVIDYETFDINVLRTFGRIQEYLAETAVAIPAGPAR